MDLTRRLAWAALLLSSGAALAQPQPQQSSPLDTLMRPQPLAPRRDLARPDALSSPDILSSPNPLSDPNPLIPGRRPDPSCERRAAPDGQRPARTARAPLAYGGSGPGEYGRFVPGLSEPSSPTRPNAPARPAAPSAPGPTPPSQTGQFGWSDRPLSGAAAEPGDERADPQGAGATFDRPLLGDRVVRPGATVPCDETGRPLPPGTRR